MCADTFMKWWWFLSLLYFFSSHLSGSHSIWVPYGSFSGWHSFPSVWDLFSRRSVRCLRNRQEKKSERWWDTIPRCSRSGKFSDRSRQGFSMSVREVGCHFLLQRGYLLSSFWYLLDSGNTHAVSLHKSTPYKMMKMRVLFSCSNPYATSSSRSYFTLIWIFQKKKPLTKVGGFLIAFLRKYEKHTNPWFTLSRYYARLFLCSINCLRYFTKSFLAPYVSIAPWIICSLALHKASWSR